MQRPDILTQQITGPFFPATKLRLRRPCAVNYIITASLSQSVQRSHAVRVSHLIIAVPSLGLQSPPLYYQDSYLIKFEKAGSFTIECVNVPGMTQTVSVSESPSSSELESDSLEAASRDNYCSNNGTERLRQSQFVWAKRPRNRKRNLLQQKLKPFQKGSFDSQPSAKVSSDCVLADAVVSAIVNNDLPLTKLSSDENVEISKNVTETSEPNGTKTEKTSVQSDTVIEQVTFTGLSSEETIRILLNLKRKYEPKRQKSESKTDNFTSILEFREHVFKLVPKDLLELFLPKGHSARRLRRTNERMEARFQRLSNANFPICF